MPPDATEDQTEGQTETPGAPANAAQPASQGATPSPAGQLSISPELARATPEFRAQEAATRSEARGRGALEAENKRLREEAAAARAAVEAQAVATQAAELRGVLGEEGFAEYLRIAEMSNSDPAGAARAMLELGTRVKSVQSPAAPPPVPISQGATSTGAANFGTRGVSAAAPLGGTGNDPLTMLDQIGAEAQTQFEKDVERVQSRDSRWTGRNFTAALANLLQGSYAKRIAEKVRDEAGQGAYAGLLRGRR